MSEILYWSATKLADAIKNREVSAREAVEACLARIETVNPRINAVVQLKAEESMVLADACDRGLGKGSVSGPLHGVPITLKDSIDTAGIISTGASFSGM